jgi:alkylated DNA repair protein alkB family protein 8
MPPGPFSFIEFDCIKDSEAALTLLSNATVLNRQIRCRYILEIPDIYSRNVLVLPGEIQDNIPGLHYFPEFVTDVEELRLLQEIQGIKEWIVLGHRRVKHYGYSYDYKNEGSRKVQEFPQWIRPILLRIYNAWPHTKINQLTINCYDPGEGIGPHSDSEKLFGRDAIIVVSISSGIVMDFLKEDVRKLVDVGRRSLLIMSEEARLHWKHGIRNRKIDYVNGNLKKRGLRVSLTFRRVYPSLES